jgi:hypothetical protein
MNIDLKRVRETTQEDGPSSAKRRAIDNSEPEDDKLEDWMKVVEVSEISWLILLCTRTIHGIAESSHRPNARKRYIGRCWSIDDPSNKSSVVYQNSKLNDGYWRLVCTLSRSAGLR